MMGMSFLGVFLSIVASVVALKTINRLLRWQGRAPLRRLWCLLIGIPLVIVLCLPITIWLVEVTTQTRINVSPLVGESKLAFVNIPENTTSEFSYRYSQVGVTLIADFKMSEADYLQWMRSQQWKPLRFEIGADGQPVIRLNDERYWRQFVSVTPVRLFGSGKSMRLRRGYRAFTSMPDNPDNTKTIIYDLDEGRVYFEWTTY